MSAVHVTKKSKKFRRLTARTDGDHLDSRSRDRENELQSDVAFSRDKTISADDVDGVDVVVDSPVDGTSLRTDGGDQPTEARFADALDAGELSKTGCVNPPADSIIRKHKS
ncbi:hypothetical protein QR680_000465 [Steinernema hermaphroditum]|uniref:Uncharacterized protein n=1 Tax=Steinernema hermaphroditum TaxID=289476 RepID=A0AA39GVJ8_9BILA|nr:hypothetical protein QR680_000465 [Steinernema hermaphroditum]